jgi:hypothetical protein
VAIAGKTGPHLMIEGFFFADKAVCLAFLLCSLCYLISHLLFSPCLPFSPLPLSLLLLKSALDMKEDEKGDVVEPEIEFLHFDALPDTVQDKVADLLDLLKIDDESVSSFFLFSPSSLSAVRCFLY